jgi:hypothetical protein
MRGEVSYRLLKSYLPKASDRFKEAAFMVSVDRELDRSEVEALICEIVRNEKPAGFERLAIAIYHDLDEYIPPVGAPVLERKLAEHEVAHYWWNVGLTGSQQRLHISRDKDGKLLSPWKSYEFDHTTQCAG